MAGFLLDDCIQSIDSNYRRASFDLTQHAGLATWLLIPYLVLTCRSESRANCSLSMTSSSGTRTLRHHHTEMTIVGGCAETQLLRPFHRHAVHQSSLLKSKTSDFSQPDFGYKSRTSNVTGAC